MLLEVGLLLASVFRVEAMKSSFHVEIEERPCGCDEPANLDLLKAKVLTPQDFLTHHAKVWLGGIEARNASKCAQLCMAANGRTTHFSFEGK